MSANYSRITSNPSQYKSETDLWLEQYCKMNGYTGYFINPCKRTYTFHKTVTHKRGQPSCECGYCGKSKGWAWDDYLEAYACQYCGGKLHWDPDEIITEEVFDTLTENEVREMKDERFSSSYRGDYAVMRLIDDFYSKCRCMSK